MLARERLTRLEPLLGLGVGFHGFALMLSGTGSLVTWVAIAATGAASIAGLGPLRRFATTRGAVLAGAVSVIAADTGGFSSHVTWWLLGAVLVYPMIVEHPPGWLYVLYAAAVYLALGLVGPGFGEGVIRAALGAVVGLVAWGLGSSSSYFAGERARVQSELADVQGRLQVAFANASSGMAMTELTGVVTQANHALGDLTGHAVDELRGGDWLDLIHPSDRGRIATRIEQLTQGEVWSFREEVQCLHADGKLVWALVGAAVVTDDDGVPQYLFINFQDITGRMSTELTLRASEEHYRALFGRSPIAIWEADFTEVGAWLEQLRAGGVTDLRAHLEFRQDHLGQGLALINLRDVNEAALRLVEASSIEELRQQFPLHEVGVGTVDALIEQFVAIWDGRDRVQGSIRARSLANAPIEGILHWVAPVVQGERDLSKVVLAFADFTESRRAEEALHRLEERLRVVLSAAPIFIFALDRHGVFTLSEGQALQSIAQAPGEAVGRSVFELFRGSPQMMSAVRRALAGEAFTTSVQIRGRSFDARMAPIWQEDRVGGVIGVANDVTERKRATEQLEQLVREKDRFVASVSHELRTPLTAVVGFTQELREGLERFSREDLETMVQLVAEQAVEVADLVEDLLVAARADIDAVAIYPESLEVAEQVELVLLAWRGDRDADVVIHGEPAKAHADPIRLRQVLRNLLTNARRYGGSRVEVAVASSEETTTVEVRDDGPGIPERDRDQIFEPYFRSTEGDVEVSSVGLGLTVSRQLARLMGGDLTYRYENGWSVFSLSLPRG